MPVQDYDDTFLDGEIIDLQDEIAMISPTDTPLYTLVAGRGQVSTANDITVSWRQKQLNTDRGTLKLEGAEAGDAISSSRSMKSNLCQIMEKVTSVSGTVRALRAEGRGDEFLEEIEDRMIEMKRDCEWYFLQGTKTQEDEGTNTPRQMDGLLNLVENTEDLSEKSSNTNTLEENDLLDLMQSIWDKGAQGSYYCFLNAGEKRIVNDLIKEGSNTRLIVEDGNNVLGVKVNQVDSDFGTINFVLNRHMPTEQLLVVDLDLVEIENLRAPFYEDLAKTGDYTKGHVVTENTIKLENTYAGGKIVNVQG